MHRERGDRSDALDAIANELESIAERLAEIAIDTLRDALEDPDSDGRRPELEKRLARARRSVEKASVLLRDGSTAGMI